MCRVQEGMDNKNGDVYHTDSARRVLLMATIRATAKDHEREMAHKMWSWQSVVDRRRRRCRSQQLVVDKQRGRTALQHGHKWPDRAMNGHTDSVIHMPQRTHQVCACSSPEQASHHAGLGVQRRF